MKKAKLLNCKVHPEQKLHKFCKNSGCWIRLCPKCAIESHKGHKVIEYGSLSSEVRNAKDKLLQARKGDLISMKRIMSNVSTLESQLKEVHEKHREDKKLAETHILSKIERIAEENEAKFKQLTETFQKIQRTLDESYNAQAQELSKIPQLADAVITQGTIDDLRTFFEMCQQGVESNSEIFEYKKSADSLRENIQKFSMQSPFDFVFKLDESSTPFQCVESSLNSEKSYKETFNRTLTSIELPTYNNHAINSKSKKNVINARHTRIRSALPDEFSSTVSSSLTTRNLNKLSSNSTYRGMPSRRLNSSRASLCSTLSKPRTSTTSAKYSGNMSMRTINGQQSNQKTVRKSNVQSKVLTASNKTKNSLDSGKVDKLKKMKNVIVELKNQLKLIVREVKNKGKPCISMYPH